MDKENVLLLIRTKLVCRPSKKGQNQNRRTSKVRDTHIKRHIKIKGDVNPFNSIYDEYFNGIRKNKQCKSA